MREQVVVYLDQADAALLDLVASKTHLPKTELFRRGLRQLAGELLPERRAGSGFEYLVSNAVEDDFPADASERLDEYLYGSVRPGKSGGSGGKKRKRARLR